jgi:predicted DNA-binding transcriptional regulator AlpA
MSSPAPLLVTLTVPQLRELVGEVVRDALAAHGAPAETDWLDMAQACRHVGVSAPTLRKHGPPPARFGGQVRYRRSDLDAWMSGRRLRVAR